MNCKASQSLPPAGGKKIKIIFRRDLCVRENTAQAASVEFRRYTPKLCAQQPVKLFGRKFHGNFRQVN